MPLSFHMTQFLPPSGVGDWGINRILLRNICRFATKMTKYMVQNSTFHSTNTFTGLLSRTVPQLYHYDHVWIQFRKQHVSMRINGLDPLELNEKNAELEQGTV